MTLSRRAVLKGAAGASLLLPWLPSLGHAQPTSPKRFFALLNYSGCDPTMFFPSATTTRVSDELYSTRLASIGGPLSTALGTRLDAFRAKLNIYRGLDIVTSGGDSGNGHSNTHALVGSRRLVYGDYEPDTMPGQCASIDCVLARARAFYPSTPMVAALRGQADQDTQGMSYDRSATGQQVRVPYDKSPTALFNKVFTGAMMPAPTSPTRSRFDVGKATIVDRVLGDFRRLRDSNRLSSEDRARVEQYVEHMHSLQQRLQVPDPTQPAVACQAPTLRSTSSAVGDQRPVADREAFMRNMADVIIAAFACDATRLGALSMKDWALLHNHPASLGMNYVREIQFAVEFFEYVLRRMDGFVETDGKTMLDNSVVLWANENCDADAHRSWSLPTITAGSAGGRLQTGWLLDYRQRPVLPNPVHASYQSFGRPYTQLLIALMRGLGLSEPDYATFGDGGGFGAFYSNATVYTGVANPYLRFSATRNNPLPFVLV